MALAWGEDDLSMDWEDVETVEAGKEILYLCHRLHHGKQPLAEVLRDFTRTRTIKSIDVNEDRQNALHITCANYKGRDIVEVVRILVNDVGMPVNDVDIRSRNALHHLMLRNDVNQVIDVVELLIERKIDVQCRDVYGKTALHLLCSRSDECTPVQLVRLLLDNWLDVNVFDYKCETALHALCQNTHMFHRVDVADAMVAYGFDLVNAESVNGNTALTLLFQLKRNYQIKDMALFLIEQGTNVDSPNVITDVYPLHLLCENYKGDDIVEILAALAGRQVDIRRKTKDNKNVLHLIFQHYTNNDTLVSVVDYLIASRVNVRERDDGGKVPISYLYTRDFKHMPHSSTIDKLLERMERHGINLLDVCSEIRNPESAKQSDAGPSNRCVPRSTSDDKNLKLKIL